MACDSHWISLLIPFLNPVEVSCAGLAGPSPPGVRPMARRRTVRCYTELLAGRASTSAAISESWASASPSPISMSRVR